ncbi:mutator type transposase, partial [Tanacetum coccineum]
LQSTNPNTTVKIIVERNTDPSLPTRVFQRIYVCLGALKSGFRACRRDPLGLDGAFMKGQFPGQCLGDDIDLYPNSNFTIISDRQKGIISAIKTVYPNAEHRYCLRHIHEKMKQGWCGQAYKDLLWRSASAINVRDFKSRAKSDLLLNSICEVFNGKIVGGRDKPVITLLEYIREYCMKRCECTRKGRTITYQSCGNIGHNKATCKGQRRKATTGGNNAEGSGSASRQAQQTEPVVGQDGSGGSGAGAVIGLSAAAGEGGAGDPGGAGVASQGSSHTRWTRRRVQTERISPQKRTPTQPANQPSTSSQVPVSQTRNADGREMGDGVPTQSSAAGGASEWSFL